VSGQQHAPATLYPRERPGTHFTGGWVGHRAGLETKIGDSDNNDGKKEKMQEKLIKERENKE